MTVASLQTATSQSHTSVVTADIYTAGVAVSLNLPVVSGSVTIDGRAALRRRCTVTVLDVDGTYAPSTPSSRLAPYGNELVLKRGVTGDMASLGVFRIATAKVNDTGPVTIELAGFDRAGTVQAARFETPYTVAAGTNYATAIQALITSRYSGLTFSFATTSRLTPLLVFEEGSDPWEAAQKMAASIGMEVFFDAVGTCVLRPEPDPNAVGVAVTTYTEGTAGVVVEVTNDLDADPGYNKFIVSGEPVDGSAPVRAEALDNNPASPTYFYGAYGRRPRFFRSQFITTTAQAQETANALLLRELGGSEQVSFSAVPNPAHDAGDIVRVVRARIGVDTVAVIDSLTMPLEPAGLMRVATRKQRRAT